MKKVTVGRVEQTYNDAGKCIKQEFIAIDDVSWETVGRTGKIVATRPPDEPEHEYQRFDMVQPQGMTVALVGNLSEGFGAVGPFTDFAEACRWSDGQEAWAVTMRSPYEEFDDPKIREDRLVELKARLDAVKESNRTVLCTFCHKQVPAATAHAYDGCYVGDECCWDERMSDYDPSKE